MNLEELFKDRTIKAKAKVAHLGDGLLNGELSSDELLAFAESSSGVDKATCIEALEYATKKDQGVADKNVLDFVTKALQEEPRIKWESAKVIGNIAPGFSKLLTKPLNNILSNADHNGTVVRWATAYALGEILKLKTRHNTDLMPAIEALSKKEKDKGVKKKYLDAIKKMKK